ncbi:beta-1,4 N-acetylgalactosaminyltransferase 2-like [Branchiostoma floridae x Branchiostoma japonicum]
MALWGKDLLTLLVRAFGKLIVPEFLSVSPVAPVLVGGTMSCRGWSSLSMRSNSCTAASSRLTSSQCGQVGHTASSSKGYDAQGPALYPLDGQFLLLTAPDQYHMAILKYWTYKLCGNYLFKFNLTAHSVAKSDPGAVQAPSGYEVKTILRSLRREQEDIPTEEETPCKCDGQRPAHYLSEWELENKQKELAASLERFEKRRIDLRDVYNQVEGSSPISYPAHGVYCRPLKTVRLKGVRIDWFEASVVQDQTQLTVHLSAEKGVFDLASSVDDVAAKGEGTEQLTIRTTNPTLLNRQLQYIVYRSTLYDANTFDLVRLQYAGFSETIPIHIQQVQLPWLYDQKEGKFQDRVTVVVKTFFRYSNLKRLIASFQEHYPGTRMVIADDTPGELFTSVQAPNVDHFRMPDKMGYFAGRNLGLSQVSTEYFLYTDDDHYIRNDTRLDMFVSLLDKTNFHLVSATVEERESMFSSTLEVTGDKNHICLLQHYEPNHFHEIPGFPGCYANEICANFFMASTNEVKSIGFDPDPANARIGHQELFFSALGRLRTAACRNNVIGHNRTGPEYKDYAKFRHGRGNAKALRIHNLLKHNLACTQMDWAKAKTKK